MRLDLHDLEAIGNLAIKKAREAYDVEISQLKLRMQRYLVLECLVDYKGFNLIINGTFDMAICNHDLKIICLDGYCRNALMQVELLKFLKTILKSSYIFEIREHEIVIFLDSLIPDIQIKSLKILNEEISVEI